MSTKINEFGVSLNFKNKDCILLSDMDKEDDKYKVEEFLHPITDSDKIKELFTPKVLTETQYYQFNPVSKLCEEVLEQQSLFNNGEMDNNLILKGNNLIGL